jgi:hypothetical protein
MNLQERMEEARERQRRRGRLRWLLDDFCRRYVNVPLRRGELLDLGDDVRAFSDADDTPEPTEDDLRSMRGATISGLKAVFDRQPWSLGRVPVEINVTRDDRELRRKIPAGVVDHEAGMVIRLLLPLRLHTPKGKEPLSTRFTIAAAQEVMNGWRLVGRCPRCESFFYVVRRQRFCSIECKQEEMDERKARRRGRPAPRRLSVAERKAKKAADQHKAGLEHDHTICPTCAAQTPAVSTPATPKGRRGRK